MIYSLKFRNGTPYTDLVPTSADAVECPTMATMVVIRILYAMYLSRSCGLLLEVNERRQYNSKTCAQNLKKCPFRDNWLPQILLLFTAISMFAKLIQMTKCIKNSDEGPRRYPYFFENKVDASSPSPPPSSPIPVTTTINSGKGK